MKLKWTSQASRNLDDIERYIEQNKPRAAIKTGLEIIRQVENLTDHPGLGRQGRVDGTRELVITGLPYIVPYYSGPYCQDQFLQKIRRNIFYFSIVRLIVPTTILKN